MNFVNPPANRSSQVLTSPQSSYFGVMAKRDTKKAGNVVTVAEQPPTLPVTDDLLTNREQEGIAYRIELTRAIKGLSQTQFASKAGLKNSAYSQWKTSTNRISIESANALCDAHTLTLDWIYRGDYSGMDKSDREALYAAHIVRKKQAH